MSNYLEEIIRSIFIAILGPDINKIIDIAFIKGIYSSIPVVRDHGGCYCCCIAYLKSTTCLLYTSDAADE